MRIVVVVTSVAFCFTRSIVKLKFNKYVNERYWAKFKKVQVDWKTLVYGLLVILVLVISCTPYSIDMFKFK